jgi:hypothetical protein
VWDVESSGGGGEEGYKERGVLIRRVFFLFLTRQKAGLSIGRVENEVLFMLKQVKS